MKHRKLTIAELTKDGLQTRVSLDEETVAEYAEAMANGASFPPVIVHTDGKTYWLSDGFHRVEAALRNHQTSVEAQIVERSSFKEALLDALGANARHGLRRTNADKQNALRLAWEHRRELFGENDPTAEWMAKTCGVTRKTAQVFYSQMCNKVTDLTPVRQSETGRVYAVQTKPKAPVKPVPPAPVKESKPVPKVMRDCHGIPIPKRLESVFSSSLLQDHASTISRVKCGLQSLMDIKHPDVEKLSNRVVAYLENAYHEIKAAMPFCVCPVCKGEGCRACGDAGYQNEDQYNRTPKEMR